jgi:hypothetical protein
VKPWRSRDVIPGESLGSDDEPARLIDALELLDEVGCELTIAMTHDPHVVYRRADVAEGVVTGGFPDGNVMLSNHVRIIILLR